MFKIPLHDCRNVSNVLQEGKDLPVIALDPVNQTLKLKWFPMNLIKMVHVMCYLQSKDYTSCLKDMDEMDAEVLPDVVACIKGKYIVIKEQLI